MNEVMDIMSIILSCLVLNFIVFDFLGKIFFRLYKNKKIYIISYVFASTLFIGVNMIGIPIFNFAYGLMEVILIALLLYNGEAKKKIICLIIFLIAASMCEVIAILVTSLILPNTSNATGNFLGVSLAQILIIAFYWLIIAFFKKHKIGKMTNTQFSSLFALPLLSIGIIVLLWEMCEHTTENNFSIATMGVATGLVIVNVYMMYLFEFVTITQELKQEMDLFSQQSDIQYRYYRELEQKQGDFSKLTHDIRNHLKAIEGLYQIEEMQKANEYTNKIYKVLDKYGVRQYTTNPVLNVILHSKITAAKHLGIDLICELEDEVLDFMKDIDITTIFTNLMDNAMEECVRMKEKRIILRVYSFNDFADIFISNPTNSQLSELKALPKSRKGERQGIGIPNVIRTVETYGGDIQLKAENGKFTVNIVIPKQ